MIRGPGIGKRHAGCTFDGFEIENGNRAALDACRRVAAGESEGVILLGPVGRGKTHLLAALAKAFDGSLSAPPAEDPIASEPLPPLRELVAQLGDADDAGAPALDHEEIRRKCHIEFWPMLDLVSELRGEIRSGEFTLSERCRTCDLLVLDDFGQERATDFVLEELERVVDWRYRNQLPIAVSTNLTVKQMSDPGKYGERAISRWAESCEMVQVGGGDYRRQVGEGRAAERRSEIKGATCGE